MNVLFLADAGNADGTIGGAEFTMREFADAAPETVTITRDLAEADTVVVGNCVNLDPSITSEFDGKRIIRYHHDLARHEHPHVREWLEANAVHVFTSPMHRDLYGLDGDHEIIPPALNLDAFRPTRQQRRHGTRTGTCSVASWQGPGKGQQHLREWSDEHGQVDVYGTGPYTPHGPNLNVLGPLKPEGMAVVLQSYQRFVFLPTAPEPFGRCVIEAWAAGCELVVNRQVGALHFIQHDRDALTSAATDFWALVTRAEVTA